MAGSARSQNVSRYHLRTPPVVLMQPSSRCCSGTTLYIYVRFGRVCGRRSRRSSTDEVPDHFDRDAVSGHSALKRAAAPSTEPARTSVPARRPVCAAASCVTVPITSTGWLTGGNSSAGYAVGLQQLAAPAAVQDVIALRNTRVRGIEREASGEPEVQIAVCLQDPSCFFIKRGLVLLEPEKLTVDVERIGLVAGDPVDCPVADPAPHVDALRVRAAVHPDQRISERPASRVHRQHGRCPVS